MIIKDRFISFVYNNYFKNINDTRETRIMFVNLIIG